MGSFVKGELQDMDKQDRQGESSVPLKFCLQGCNSISFSMINMITGCLF